MTHSVNELQSLAQKAARGAGAYPAQAAHFGRAVAYHLAAQRDSRALQDALAALPAGPIQTLPMTAKTLQTPLAQSYTEAAGNARLPARLTCPDALLSTLQTFAQLTYVPATAASRAAGAGAGLTDND